MSSTNEPVANLAVKIAEVVAKLKPFQSLEYDPDTGSVAIVTELLVPGEDVGQISDILSRCDDEERVTVKRYADSYKVTLVRRVNL
jgi:hypothetical protein